MLWTAAAEQMHIRYLLDMRTLEYDSIYLLVGWLAEESSMVAVRVASR